MEKQSNSEMIALDEQMKSFAEALATVIDERTPYNGNHTRRVAEYTELLVDYLNSQYDAGRYEKQFKDQKEALILAAFLHDIGKTITPLAVMNKPTRLGGRLEKIRERFRYLKACMEIEFLKGNMREETFRELTGELDSLFQNIQRMNLVDLLEEKDREYINIIGEKTYCMPTGKRIHYLTKYEIECLNISVGTLTESERALMEKHVEFTEKILSKVRFTERFANVPKWAVQHHEYLDGSGYPNHLTADELDTESRILTIVDVFDAMTSPDRPYKEGASKEEALETLEEMACEGKLDGELVQYFREALHAAKSE